MWSTASGLLKSRPQFWSPYATWRRAAVYLCWSTPLPRWCHPEQRLPESHAPTWHPSWCRTFSNREGRPQNTTGSAAKLFLRNLCSRVRQMSVIKRMVMSQIPMVKSRELQGDILPFVIPTPRSLPQKRRGGGVIIDDGHLYRAIKVPIEVQGEMELETHTIIDCEKKPFWV